MASQGQAPSRSSSPAGVTSSGFSVPATSKPRSRGSKFLSIVKKPFRSLSPSRTNLGHASSTAVANLVPSSPITQTPVYGTLSCQSLASDVSSSVSANKTQIPITLEPSQSTLDIQKERYRAWRQAFGSLSLEDQQQLDQSDIKGCLGRMREVVEKKKWDCDEKGWTFQMNGETIVLRDIANKVIHWIDRFKAIGDTIVQYDPVHSALPWAAFRFLLEVSTADIKKQDAILISLEYLAGLVTRCAIYECLYLDGGEAIANLPATEDLEKRLVFLYADILIYLSKSKLYYSHGTAARLAIAIVEADLGPLMTNIKDGESDVHKAAEIASMNINKCAHEAQSQEREKLEQLLQDLEKPISRMDLKISDLHRTLDESKRLVILNWISTAQYIGHHKRARQNRLDHTGDWFLRKKHFKNWRNTSVSSLLWLHGIPGAGKTKLVSLVIDVLKESKTAGSQEALAFFYCNKNEAERSTPESVLRAIVKQLSSLEPGSGLLRPVVAKFEDEEKCNFASGPLDIEECCSLIIKLLSSYPKSNIVIDALDECDKNTRSKLISALSIIIKSTPNLVKIFVSSRDDDDIVLRLSVLPHLRISSNDNSGDIESFVRSETDKCISEKDFLRGEVSESLKAHVTNTLIEGADGMFMWADLQIKALCDNDRFHTELDVRAELGRLPTGLRETYSQIFRIILSHPEDSKLLAMKALKWIMCAKRPLSPSELIAAISFQSELNEGSAQNQRLKKETILRFCHNLVVWDSEFDVMRFAHLSVQDFLDENHLKMVDAHRMVAETCLGIICLPNKHSDQANSTSMAVYELPYCTEHWAYHVRSCGHQTEESAIIALQREFFGISSKPSSAFAVWRDNVPSFTSMHLAPYSFFSGNGEWDVTPLMTAARYNLEDMVEYLLACDRESIEIPNKHGRTPLMMACQGGLDAIVCRLLEAGANPNHEDIYGRTALMVASYGESLSVLEMLLDGGADPNHEDTMGMTVLMLLSMTGHDMVVKLLLDRGANPNQMNIYGATALEFAMFDSHKKLLLDKGARSWGTR